VSVSYQAVGWNRQKKVYDAWLAAGVVLYLVLFVGVGFALHPDATAETMLIRGFGTAAFLLLHLVLSIGPLCRLDPRFLPLLYNRRHLGVTMFTLALVHGGFSVVQFHGFGDVNPLLSVLTANPRVDSLSQFPFEPLGLAALAILFVMAATSHDFWLANLSAPAWKALHMLVYAAYALLVLHVALGVLQAETSPALSGLLGAGVAWVLGLHAAAALKERRQDRDLAAGEGEVDVCGVDEIRDHRAKVVTLAGERVAVFRYDGKVSAISNVCQHQNGPLGEGKVVDGLVVCPWHGYQYKPDCGASPAPYTDKVPTFRVRVAGGRVLVDPRPLPPGTYVEPARIEGSAGDA
jgi:nitrite reductase/ring-hydroxylating ferredoxin subunit/DMSO/TMAO reductase YedYZ heme-binding membrane subunit